MLFPRETHRPLPLGEASRGVIENLAEEVASTHDFHQTYSAGYTPNKLHKMVRGLVEKLGGRIFIGSFPIKKGADEQDSLIVYAPDDFIIAPAGSMAVPAIAKTQALINAAELGHLFLHYPMLASRLGPGVVMTCPRHGAGPEQEACDREARWFAEALVLPRAAFLAAWTHHRGNTAALADDFDVTETQIVSRAMRVGFILSAAA